MVTIKTEIDFTSTAEEDDKQTGKKAHQDLSIHQPQFIAPEHSQTSVKDEPDEPRSEYHFEAEEPQPSSSKLHSFIEALDQVKVEPRRSESPDLLIVDEVPAKNRKRQNEMDGFKSELPAEEQPQTSNRKAQCSSEQQPSTSSTQEAMLSLEEQMDPSEVTPSNLSQGRERLELALKKHADLPIGYVLQMANGFKSAAVGRKRAFVNEPPAAPQKQFLSVKPPPLETRFRRAEAVSRKFQEKTAQEKARVERITLSLETILRLVNSPYFDEIVSDCYVRFYTKLPNGIVKLAYVQHAVDLSASEQSHGITYSKSLFLFHGAGYSKREECKSLHYVTNSTEITDDEYLELKGNSDSKLDVVSERIRIKESQLRAALGRLPPITAMNTGAMPINFWEEKVISSEELAPCFLTRSQILNLIDAKLVTIPQILVGCYIRGLAGKMAKIVYVSKSISDWFKGRQQQSSLKNAHLDKLSIKYFRIQHVFGGAVDPSFAACCLYEIGDEPLSGHHFNKWVWNKKAILPTLEYIDWKAQQLSPHRNVLDLQRKVVCPIPRINTTSQCVKNNANARPVTINTQIEQQPDERDEAPILVIHTRQHETSRTILQMKILEKERRNPSQKINGTFEEVASTIPVFSPPPNPTAKCSTRPFFASLPRGKINRSGANEGQMADECESPLEASKQAEPVVKISRTEHSRGNQPTTSKTSASHQPTSVSITTDTFLHHSEEIQEKPSSSFRVFMPKRGICRTYNKHLDLP